MNTTASETAFIVSISVTVAVSLATIAYLHKSMQRILIELCGSAERTSFWCAFAHVVFVLAPVILLLMAYGAGKQSPSVLVQVTDQMRWALFGLFFAVLCVAVTIASSIGRFEQRAGTKIPKVVAIPADRPGTA